MSRNTAVTYDPETRTYRLPLTKGLFAIIDLEDVAWVTQWKWHATHGSQNRTFYAVRTVLTKKGCRKLYLARALMEHWGYNVINREVDHISMNTLDDRRANLRLATREQNQRNVGRQRRNTSGVRGVYWHAKLAKWHAQIGVDGKRLHLGYFATKAEAAAAYAAASKRYHGEFGRVDVAPEPPISLAV